MNNLTLLARLGLIPPQAWDFIVPQGPWLAAQGIGRAATPYDAYVLAAAQLAREVSTATVAADYTDQDAAARLARLVDEWCGTPWPRKWPIPFPWPFPWPPEPDPWWDAAVQAGRVAAAVHFATMGERLRDSELGPAFTDAAGRLLEAAMPGDVEAVATKAVSKARRTTRRG